jgi:DNA-binding MarR family transcriptional regulator
MSPPAPVLSELELAAWQGYLSSHADLMRDLDTLLRSTADMSMGAFAVLHLLTREAGGSLRLTEIAERTRITISGVSRIVTTLAEHGFVERQPDEDDGRAWRIARTSAGAMHVAEALPAVTAFIRERFTHRFSEDELSTICGYCDRLEQTSTGTR